MNLLSAINIAKNIIFDVLHYCLKDFTVSLAPKTANFPRAKMVVKACSIDMGRAPISLLAQGPRGATVR